MNADNKKTRMTREEKVTPNRHGIYYDLLAKITSGLTQQQLSEKLGLSPKSVRQFISKPETYSSKWIKNFTAKLLEFFPDKSPEITKFVFLTYRQTLSGHQILMGGPKIQQDFRQATGALLRELREECGLTVEELQSKINHPILPRHIPRVEAGDKKLDLSIYRGLIGEVCKLLGKTHPDVAAPFIPVLTNMSGFLRR